VKQVGGLGFKPGVKEVELWMSRAERWINGGGSDGWRNWWV